MNQTTNYVKCYHSHPALTIKLTQGDLLRITNTEGWDANGVEVKMHGGSCLSPSVTDADVYIGFDSGMKVPRVYPWNQATGPVHTLFPIVDGSIPDNKAEFRKMIEWAAVQLIAGKKVHMGCIGGHGRTGMALAALVQYMTGNADAITYVRENYCKKAVESETQVEFLYKEYGINKVKGSRAIEREESGMSTYTPQSWTNSKYAYKDDDLWGGVGTTPPRVTTGHNGKGTTGHNAKLSLPKGVFNADPTTNPICVWGDAVDFRTKRIPAVTPAP